MRLAFWVAERIMLSVVSPLATAMRLAISSIGNVDSSVSIKSRSAGINLTASGLNFSPIEKYIPGMDSKGLRTLLLARKPCNIQACLGERSR